MTIEVKNCASCPFRVDEFDPDSIGYDTTAYCNNLKYLPNSYIIVSFDSCEEDIDIPELMKVKDNCPLLKDEITIKLI